MTDPWTRIETEIEADTAELVALRRDLHRHPEYGFRETRTAGIVARFLRESGIEVTEGIGGTGVVGTLRGDRAGNRAIGLRADMDALAIVEATGLPHASVNEGFMHACGHDGHTAMLLGAARVLSRNRDFAGTVQFIFQPAEEGLGGAPAMLDDGLFERFPVDAVFGLHNKPGLPLGSLNTTPGPMLAAGDTFAVRFGGQGGHGGSGPHLSIDPTLAMAQFITNLQTIIGRDVWAMDQAVVSVGHVNGGSYESPNVIPVSVVVRGTARSFSAQTRDLIERRLRDLAAAAASAFGTTLDITYDRLFAPMVNDEAATARCLETARKIAGPEGVNGTVTRGMGSEDFSFMLEKVPGCFVFLGAGEGPALHSDRYDFNDLVLPQGVRYWARRVFDELGKGAG
jgi:amidohydrolase